MTNSQRLATVRNRLKEWIAQTHPGDFSEPILREAILIRDEFYVGRRFYTDSYRAIWFIEQDELKIFGPDGQLACVLSRDEIDQPQPSRDLAAPNVLRMPQSSRPDGQGESEIRRAA